MTVADSKLISSGSDWDFETLAEYDQAIAELAHGKFGLDTYPNQIEVISSEQMMDAYSSVGMPVGYNHWSFGKQFVEVESRYRRGQMGLAYEIVINSNPCIAYLMEENTITMQALVIAHAGYGHNSFFKGNYLFKTWTDASAIIDYLVFARHYLAECEQRHGVTAVEETLDSCHALMNYGVDRYKRPTPISAHEEKRRQRDREEALQRQVSELWKTFPDMQPMVQRREPSRRFPSEPQENLLYFLEKNAPLLEPWQREVIRIVRKMAQYFYPQRQTQVMNEGWATFWHYTLLNELYDQGRVDDGFMLEFLQNHSQVIYQPPFDSPYYSGINPYALGFAMFQDIRRICEAPTDEDRQWFPDIAGSDWLATLKFAMESFKDESFIQQFLSPRLIREFKLFSLMDDSERDYIEINAIHNEPGYQAIRNRLSEQYNLSIQEPNIQVYSADVRGDRSLTLQHLRQHHRPLEADTAQEVLRHLHRLWGFDVHLESVDNGSVVERLSIPSHRLD
ncbi:MAG: SpoVR family protein [Alcanivorax sp.]|jgi:stage V sporulation protein R|uniref:SpoVR family protein n=2 Tax=Alloalcanivorax TaxID=3020832 RepID=UPI000796C6AD|nr:MAG: SpoVR family protein [Alcanivorax sp. Nap_24]MBD3651870.1 SpoVR family protein [Alcanivorax sp.]MEA3259384.1 SpoVR family protein [Pseudomonadota bacterium]MBL4723043.1 SpoVR family protein [Alcanivorax sp.]MEC8879907.1 SpoVR family protein [Pseudomonadota bacterium]|tara:strand:- start:17045 stop:18565 length:1521 start_codon:yes stop_codon:yes gene_type:complete